MNKVILVLLTASILTACAARYRAYDGVLGFQSKPQPEKPELLISYTDQATISWEHIEQHLKRGCAEALRVQASEVRLTATRQEEAAVKVSLVVPTVGAVQSMSVKNNVTGSSSASYSAETINQSVEQTLLVRSLHAVCSTGSAAP